MQNPVESLEDDQPLNPYTEIQILQDHNDVIKFLLPISENKFLSVSDDNTGIVWDVVTACKLCTLVGHTRPITCASLMTPPLDEETQDAELSGCLLVTGSSDKTIRVWSTETGACLQTITEHNATTKAMLCFPNVGLFCTGGQDLFLWNSEGKLLQQVQQEAEAVGDCPVADIQHMLAISEDRLIMAAGSALEVFGIETQIGQLGDTCFQLRRIKKLMPQHREAVMCLTRISDSYFASASLDGTVKVWSSHTLATSRHLNHIQEYERNGYPWCVQHMVPFDSKHLCITVGSGLAVYDIITGDCLWMKTEAHFSRISHIAVVYEGKFLATCSEDGTIRLWGVDPRLKGGDDNYPQKEFSLHQFSTLVEASHHREMKGARRLFQREETRPPLLCLQGECVAHSGAVQMVMDFTLSGMASCGVDGLVILWKDGVLESAKRNELIRDMLCSKSGVLG